VISSTAISGVLRLDLVDPGRYDLQRVDVQPRVGLVHHRQRGLQHGELQDLVALLLAAREAVVHRALRETGSISSISIFSTSMSWKSKMSISSPPLGVERRAHEVGDRDAGDLDRVLEGQEDARVGALVRLHVQDALAAEEDVAVGHLVRRMAGDHLGERALARAVRTHDRVDLALVHLQVHPRRISVPSSAISAWRLVILSSGSAIYSLLARRRPIPRWLRASAHRAGAGRRRDEGHGAHRGVEGARGGGRRPGCDRRHQHRGAIGACLAGGMGWRELAHLARSLTKDDIV
jgi:hypothetical protein